MGINHEDRGATRGEFEAWTERERLSLMHSQARQSLSLSRDVKGEGQRRAGASERASKVASELASTPASSAPRGLVLTVDERSAPVRVSDRDPLIRLFGPVEVVGAHGPVEQSKRASLTEMLAYMHLRPGARDTDFCADLWPGRRIAASTRLTAASKARRWLGVDHREVHYLPRADGMTGGYTLRDEVRSDWSLIRRVAASRKDMTVQQLAAALKLVRGKPFEGVPRDRYSWTSVIHEQMVQDVVDVAHELAERALDAGDTETALWATERGLVADPIPEQLWRDRLMAARGDVQLHRHLSRLMHAIAHSEDYTLSTETENLAQIR